MRGKIWIDDMSESDRALAFKAVQKLDGFYRRRTVGRYKCFYLRSETDVWNDVSIDCYRESELPEITLQQLLKLAGMEEFMTTKQLSKKDLVAGKHVFKTREGGYYLVINTVDNNLAGVNLDGMSHFGSLDNFQEDLSYRQCSVKDDLDIVEVLIIESSTVFDYLHRNLKSIWQRTEKSASQIELEKLQQQIAELQVQANKLQSTL